MTFVAYIMTDACNEKLPHPSEKGRVGKLGLCISVTLATFDICAPIAAIALGILAIFAIIPLPPAAAYTLIAAGGTWAIVAGTLLFCMCREK